MDVTKHSGRYQCHSCDRLMLLISIVGSDGYCCDDELQDIRPAALKEQSTVSHCQFVLLSRTHLSTVDTYVDPASGVQPTPFRTGRVPCNCF